MDKHLIIFIKKPPPEALEEHHLENHLHEIQHVASITSKVNASKHVYFDKHIENDSFFDDKIFQKKIHKGTHSKQQLSDALKESFGQWAKKVVFMCSDDRNISRSDIEMVFKKLDSYDFVILPELSAGISVFGTTFFDNQILNYFPCDKKDDLLDIIIMLKSEKIKYCILS